METLLKVGYDFLDKGLLPDFILRPVKLQEIHKGSFADNHITKMNWIEHVRARPTIADNVEQANEQHYEVPTEFILSCLGPYAKYSCCLYPTGEETLEAAEVLMLESYCNKAQLKDGLDILDLGCGWGSLSLYLARKYPNSSITGLSNSATQKMYIDSVARAQGFSNIEIITTDINVYDFSGSKVFDRIISIEMFEHMKNYQILLKKISTWLRPKSRSPFHINEQDEALLFVHIFCHRTTPYHFEEGWMAKNFFSGGTMPSHDLLLYFQSDLTLVRSWYIDGRHYSRTLEDWLKRQDANASAGLQVLENDAEAKGLSRGEGRKVFYRFRVFYLACSELFGLNGGQEWGVGHYLFKAKDFTK